LRTNNKGSFHPWDRNNEPRALASMLLEAGVHTADDQATVAPLSSLIKKQGYMRDEQPWTT